MSHVSSNPLLLICVLVILACIKVAESQDTSFEINAFTNNSLQLTYQRDAYVPPDTNYVSIVTPYGPDEIFSSTGRVLYTDPIQMWDETHQASFDTTITLQVTPFNATGKILNFFFIVPVNSTSNTSGGDSDNLGIYDPGYPYFTVELDYQSSSIYDPKYPHMGININSLLSQNYTKLENSVGQLVTLRITYDAPARKIRAVAMYGSTVAVARFAFNLMGLLPQKVQVGLSASTQSPDNLVAYFDFYSWRFYSFMGPDINVKDDTYIY